MQGLIVTAHPMKESLTAQLAAFAGERLAFLGHEVSFRDLYGEGFDPVMSQDERAHYYEPGAFPSELKEDARRLRMAEALVLVFPTWWFGPPAMMKGWFDRVWVPGVAFSAPHEGSRPALERLRHVLMVTTLNFDEAGARELGSPVETAIGDVLLGRSAPQAAFEALSLHSCASLDARRLSAFQDEIEERLAAW